MLGGRSKSAVQEFWDHCLALDEWKNHPVFLGVPPSERSSLMLSRFLNVLFMTWDVDK